MSRMSNDKVDLHSLKPSCLEDTCCVEENSCCKSSCPENSEGCNNDIPPLKLDDRLSNSIAQFHNTKTCESSSSSSSPVCQTPTKCIFDPFASGPDDLMLAPKKLKGPYRYRPLQHVLSFDLSIDSGESEADLTEISNAEEYFSELIFSSLLELIISTKLTEISANKQEEESDQTEDCKTPTSLPFLTGLADTCPPAPRRPTLFLKRFDHSICRKLDFASCLN